MRARTWGAAWRSSRVPDDPIVAIGGIRSEAHDTEDVVWDGEKRELAEDTPGILDRELERECV